MLPQPLMHWEYSGAAVVYPYTCALGTPQPLELHQAYDGGINRLHKRDDLEPIAARPHVGVAMRLPLSSCPCSVTVAFVIASACPAGASHAHFGKRSPTLLLVRHAQLAPER